MRHVLRNLLEAEKAGKKQLAVLIDPEKFDPETAKDFLQKLPSFTTHIFIGGSTVTSNEMESCVKAIKAETSLPLVLFPGDHQQISNSADALLFLSLLSGRNPEYLIGQQVRSVALLKNSGLEIIPTGYLLIDGGRECAVQRVSATAPLCQQDPEHIVDTALAGKYSGKQLIYLEAGSGALHPVDPKIISVVKEATQISLIVGGGIRNAQQLEAAWNAGADLVVIGTAFEQGLTL
ncbi:MAG: geranylgeranylglyceryl/heptaprenylglyceryl phosphate synthase [Salinimicrobium sediminis]|nr:geranylgeranylglyceryl/heptaprenylglyceryl phosphate synthase [Salinimicrobium sediminis]